MKKICQVVIIFMLLFSAVVQASAYSNSLVSNNTVLEEDDIDSSFKKVDFMTKEVVIYPGGIVLIRKEATVDSGSKFYTEFEGSSFPGCVRIKEDGVMIKEITIKNNYRIISAGETNVFSIYELLKDNVGNIVELFTSDALYGGEVIGVLNGFVFLRDAEVSKIFGDSIKQKNASFICLKLQDVQNIIMLNEPDLPDLDENNGVSLDSSPKTRITWEDTGGGSRKVTLIYVISGVSWSSEYYLDTFTSFADEDDEGSRLEHWAVIKNNLNFDFVDVNVRLVAGDIKLQNYVNHNEDLYVMTVAQSYINEYDGRSSSSSQPSVLTLQEYEVYTLPYKITLRKGETKLIQIQACEVEIEEEFVYDATHFTPSRNRYSTWENEATGKVQKIFKIKNHGKTWPAGMVNVYQDYMLIGQDGIEWTPKDREAKVTIGVASDIVAKKKATVKEISPDDRYHDDYEYTITIILTNYKDKQSTVKVFDKFVSNALELTSNPDFKEKPGNQMTWEITLEPGEEKQILYTYQTRD